METTKYKAISHEQSLAQPVSPDCQTDGFFEPEPTITYPGSSLLYPSFSDSLRWYLLFIAIYTVSVLCVLVWVSTGPVFQSEPCSRVLRTGNIHVNQLYSGLFLSAILTPAAVAIRQLSDSFGKIHPFALTARMPVRSTDLDRIVEPGVLDLPYLWKYSKWTASVQSILMLAGMLLVPLGTLTVTTGTFVPQTGGRAVVGMPTYNNGYQIMYLDIMDAELYNNNLNQFATTVATLVKSNIISQNGILSSTAAILGPMPTTNITFELGVQYQGVVAYKWDAGCESADDDIEFLSTGGIFGNFTFPNGKLVEAFTWEPTMSIWSNATQSAGAMFNMDGGSALTIPIPYGGTLFFAVGVDQSEAASVPEDKTGLSFVNSTWISRIQCTPSLTWDIYSCIWNGTSMVSCQPTPGENVTALDTEGLDYLTKHMTAVPWVISNQADSVFNMDTLTAPFIYWPGANSSHQLRIPLIQDYTNLFGIVAQSISIATLAGYYGAAEVPIIGSTEREVYVSRVYMLVIVFLTLVAVTLLGTADLVRMWVKRLPYRRTGFLTVASATRGAWWDRELRGTCAMPEQKLRERVGRSVMFGVDVRRDGYVGLAPVVREIEGEGNYS